MYLSKKICDMLLSVYMLLYLHNYTEETLIDFDVNVVSVVSGVCAWFARMHVQMHK